MIELNSVLTFMQYGALVEETRSEYHAEDFSDVVIQQLIEQQRKSITVLSRCYSGADPFDDVQFV